MKTNKIISSAILFCLCIVNLNAQNLGDILSNIKNSNSGQTVSSVIDNLIGTSNISKSDIVGSWKYSKPAIAFESENALSKVGGSVISSTIETKLDNTLKKIGIASNSFTISFLVDGTFTSVVKGKTIKGIYEIDGANIILSKSATSKMKIKGNVKKGTNLQITFNADKLFEFMKQFCSIAKSAYPSISTLVSLANNYKGMQIGMSFTKQ